MMQVLALFGSSAARGVTVHRVPVLDASNKLVKIITQSGLARFLVHHGALAAPLLTAVVPHREVAVVQETDTLVAVLTKMVERRLTSVPIVDEEGGIITPISLSDLRSLARPHSGIVKWLGSPVIEFIQSVRLAQDTVSGHKITRALVCAVPAAATYDAVLHKLALHNIHRLYVEDSTGNVVGVVSMKDIAHVLVASFGEE